MYYTSQNTENVSMVDLFNQFYLFKLSGCKSLLLRNLKDLGAGTLFSSLGIGTYLLSCGCTLHTFVSVHWTLIWGPCLVHLWIIPPYTFTSLGLALDYSFSLQGLPVLYLVKWYLYFKAQLQCSESLPDPLWIPPALSQGHIMTFMNPRLFCLYRHFDH